MKVFHIYSIPRTGHHCIINWILLQNKKNAIHINNCNIENKKLTCRQITPYLFNDNILHYNEIIECIDVKIQNKIICFIRNNETIFSYNISDLDLILLSSENNILNKLNKYKPYNSDSKKIIIQRDFKNWIASLITYFKFKEIDSYTSYITIWENLSNNYNNKDVLFIKYNEWFKNIEYRKEICKNLDLKFTDEGLNEVKKFGNGSSFDNLQFNDNAQKMNVLRRYEQLEDDELYKKIINNNQHLLELSNSIFP